MAVTLSGVLPKDVANGMGAIGRALADSPDQVHVIIALVDCSKITTNTDTGEVMPTARIRAIEACADKTTDAKEWKRLWRRAMERRTHGVDADQIELPLELERELDALGADDAEPAGEVAPTDEDES